MNAMIIPTPGGIQTIRKPDNEIRKKRRPVSIWWKSRVRVVFLVRHPGKNPEHQFCKSGKRTIFDKNTDTRQPLSRFKRNYLILTWKGCTMGDRMNSSTFLTGLWRCLLSSLQDCFHVSLRKHTLINEQCLDLTLALNG